MNTRAATTSPHTPVFPVSLPTTGDPAYPYRYLIGYVHGNGQRGSRVFELPAPLHTNQQYRELNDELINTVGFGVAIHGVSLLAGPVQLHLPYSHDHAHHYTYLITYTGMGGPYLGQTSISHLIFLLQQPSTRQDLAELVAHLTEKSGLDDLQILTIDLLAAPHPSANRDVTP